MINSDNFLKKENVKMYNRTNLRVFESNHIVTLPVKTIK